MKRFFTLISILLLHSSLFSQAEYSALITDPQIGQDANAEKLLDIVDDINKRDSVSFVVVMGNITANGKFDEFLWAQEILDGLNVPYHVIGGSKDYYLSEGKGNEIKLLWGDDKFWVENNNAVHIGFNTIVPVYKFNDLIETETKEFLWGRFSNRMDATTFIYTFHNIINNNLLYELPIGVQPIFITAGGDNINKSNLSFKSVLLSKEKRTAYNIIVTKNDSVRFLKVLAGNKNEEFVNGIDKNELEIVIRNPGSEKPFSKFPVLLRRKFNTTVFTAPTPEQQNIYLPARNGTVKKIKITGEEEWTFETNGTIYSSPLIEKDLVVAATNEGDLFTINKNTGNLFQVIGTGETITSDIALADIEYNGMQTKGIIFGTAEGNFYCYELYSLEMIWWNKSSAGMINSSVAADNGKVIFQDKTGTLYCVSASNGVLLWKWKTKTNNYDLLFKSDLIVSNNNIYLTDFDGNLHCIDALLGTEQWNIKKIKATGKIKLNKKRNELVLHSENNKILIISVKNGKVTNDFKLPEELKKETATDLQIFNEAILIGFTNGTVYKLKEKGKFEKIFWQNSAPIISLIVIDNNLLVTDYDGNLTLLNLTEKN